jgi:hypothetical protein
MPTLSTEGVTIQFVFPNVTKSKEKTTISAIIEVRT